MRSRSWIIVTGEYPPKLGGVADYTRNVAMALARAGDDVHVFAPSLEGGALTPSPGVTAHVLPDHLGPRSLLAPERELGRRPEASLFVQYVPHSFGMRALNAPFAAWLAARRRPFSVLFHEVAFPILPGAPWHHNARGYLHEEMARMVARRASRIFVSTTAWNQTLRRLAPRSPDPVWLPIPSNTPETVDEAAVARVRAALGVRAGDAVIGAFGTYGGSVSELLGRALRPLLARDPRRIALLVGKGSREFAARVFPEGGAGPRVVGTGSLEQESIAAHLASCTAVLQPYPDGVNTRRTSTMAGLALGVPVITNVGHNTESIWSEERAVALAADPSVDALVAAGDALLEDDALRAETAARGLALYRRKFSLECTVRALRDDKSS